MRKLLEKITGDPNEKILKRFYPQVEKINSLEEKFAGMSDEQLREMTVEFRKKLGVENSDPYQIDSKVMEERMDAILPEAFAVVREASKRVLGLRHFDVQLLGGISLHKGQVAEMKTGEGKTLVATLPLYLNALTGRGAHLVTVNDYLARVGAGWMAEVYNFLGMSVGIITHDASYVYDLEYVDDSQYDQRLSHLHPCQRKEVYACDIVYGTNNDFGFDYLRDNMAQTLADQVQRDLNFAIIDEADSILIDEARTPLIISAPAQESTDRYFTFAQLVRRLKEGEDYNVDEKMKAVTLTEEGINKMEKWLGMDNIYVEKGIKEVHHIEQALKAHVLFTREKDYVVREGEVVIVDEFTGRLMPGRRYSEGLHQAIEAKEGLKVQRESQTLATITFQNFFRMYRKVSGMTGTAETEAEEFASIYDLETVVIPTHKPMVRKDMNDLVFRSENGKFQAVIKDILERRKKGQPVLVGTASIEKNEKLADMMTKQGIEPAILNAKNHEREAQIISQAGRPGAVTIATNMAGRGVDIILGGNPPNREEQEKVKELGGLHVLGTERHESRRIDNQLRGRAGRQGDPGSSQFYVSAEDDLMRIFGGERMKKIMSSLRVPEDTPVENKVVSRSIESAQKKVEGNNFDIRKHLVQFDNVINKHREAVYRKRMEVLELFEGEKSVRSAKDSEVVRHSDLSEVVLEMVENEIEQIVGYHTAAEDVGNWDLGEIYRAVSTIFPVQEQLEDDLSRHMKGDNKKLDKVKARTAIIDHLLDLARKNYNEIKKQFESAELGMDWRAIEKGILLRSIDNLWVEHLESMDYLRKSVGLRGYGQRDPFVEYKKEAYRLFNEFNDMLQKQVVYSVFKLAAIDKSLGDAFSAPTLAERAKKMSAPAKTMTTVTRGQAGNTSSTENIASKPKNDQGEKVGRNDPCPCGSGKKYKKCCGA
ncbi:MAG: preprotein translocase subunit SecA [Patescibacteria group bacterium]